MKEVHRPWVYAAYKAFKKAEKSMPEPKTEREKNNIGERGLEKDRAKRADKHIE